MPWRRVSERGADGNHPRRPFSSRQQAGGSEDRRFRSSGPLTPLAKGAGRSRVNDRQTAVGIRRAGGEKTPTFRSRQKDTRPPISGRAKTRTSIGRGPKTPTDLASGTKTLPYRRLAGNTRRDTHRFYISLGHIAICDICKNTYFSQRARTTVDKCDPELVLLTTSGCTNTIP
jgi:hypothetical protein